MVHSMISVEQSSHRIKQVFVVMQIFLTVDLTQLEYLLNVDILQLRVALEVLNQFLQ
jgi:hypothetical protein